MNIIYAMRKTTKYIMGFIYEMIVMMVGFILLLSVTSCEHEELTRSMDQDDYAIMIEDSLMTDDTVIIEEESGISFDMECDSLEDDVEEVRFIAKEWEEDGMEVDL